ncbi:hypothetical protein LCGC14_1769060 [marine sediment metagenome]|uniref:Uncharacterized protein n=1 Tax=marine sediment metagenome TaxID=412755 RepID=A0A0F9JDR7_9ZZZZ
MDKGTWFARNGHWLEHKLDYRFMKQETPPEGVAIHEFDEPPNRLREIVSRAILDEFIEKYDRFPNFKDKIKIRAYEPIAPQMHTVKIVIWWTL